jgi:hypothetical protein
MTKRTRRLLALGLPAALVLSLAVAAWLLWAGSRPAITPANGAKVRAGMTRPEVEALLGGPPRNELTGRPLLVAGKPLVAVDQAGLAVSAQSLRETPLVARGLRVDRWQSDDAQVLVGFDPAGRVGECVTFPMRFADESLLERLRRWLGL